MWSLLCNWQPRDNRIYCYCIHTHVERVKYTWNLGTASGFIGKDEKRAGGGVGNSLDYIGNILFLEKEKEKVSTAKTS